MFIIAVDPNPKINRRDLTFSDDDWGDLISDRSSQINARVMLSNRNGSELNLGSGGPNSTKNGLNFIANGMDLKFDALVQQGNGKFCGLKLGSNGFDLKFDGVGSNSNTSVSNSSSGNPSSVKNWLNFSRNALDLKLDALGKEGKRGDIEEEGERGCREAGGGGQNNFYFF
ncbi:hypothetical protein FF1_040461 [Malus domestica]